MTSVGRASRLREPAVRGAHLLVLSGFAVAQPLFDILSRHAEFFAVRGSTTFDIVVFALAVTLLPAATLLAVELVAGAIDARAALALHLFFVGGLAALFAIQAFKRLGLESTALLVGVAALGGAAAALAAWRLRLFRTFLTVLTPAPLVFLALFLFASPVTKLVFPGDVDVSLASVSARAPAPVVVVVFDELPVTSLMDAEGEVDGVRYPNFAKLAARSTWFRNATTLSSSTTRAVPALLTGNMPRRGKLPVFQNHPRNLFTLLGGRYGLNVVESQTHLCPRELCRRKGPATAERLSSLYSDTRVVYLHLVAPPALADRLPSIDDAWTDFGKDTVADVGDAKTTLARVDARTFYFGRVREFKGFVSSIRREAPERPRLHFLHVLLPHGPWLYFPSGRVSAVASPKAPGREGETWVDGWLALQAYQRHLLQVGFTDRLLGRLLRRLDAVGLYDRALVVVMADHGVSFRGGDKRRAPTRTNVQDLAFVPLLVKRPDQRRAAVVDRHVRIVDVLPTIADALDVDVPWRIDGHSAFGRFQEPQRVRVGRVAGDLETLLKRRDEALRRQIRLFGSGDWELFSIGSHAEVVGRRVEALPRAAEVGAEATIDEPAGKLLRSLPARSPLVPSPLAGTLSGSDASPESDVAVAVNGRIAAVAKTYETRAGAIRFSALVPETAFRPGRNEVGVFLVDATSGEPVLQEVPTSLAG